MNVRPLPVHTLKCLTHDDISGCPSCELSVRELMLNSPPANPLLVRNPLTDEKRAAMSTINVYTEQGVVETTYDGGLPDLDPRLPDPERIRVGWRSGQRTIFNRRRDDPSWLDDVGSLWRLFKRS